MFKKIQSVLTRDIALLIVVVLLGVILRFSQLGSNPPSLNWDEAAWGYNAYSIGIDGKDEFGRFLPYDYLESFGDFKPPMYAYLSVIPVKLFGLNEFSTRFASAFFGSLTVLITYFLTKSLFLSNSKFISQKQNAKNSKKSLQNEDSGFLTYIPLIASFLLAISPWHIMLSRAAFEANIATFFIVTGVWLFTWAVQEKPKWLFLSVIAFVASIYTFNSARIVAPILLICLSLGFWRILITRKKELGLAIITGVLLVVPIVSFLLSPQASLRFKEVNIFSNIEILKSANQQIENDGNAWWSKIIHNRRVVYGSEFVKHYFDNLNPDFLFIKGDGNPKFSTQDVGQMYLFEMPFFIIGVLFLFKKRNKNWWIIFLWLFIGILPAAFARETPHALRTEGALPSFQLITAFGISLTIFYLKNSSNFISRFKTIAYFVMTFALFLNVLYFLHGYYIHYPREQSGEWQYGYKESIAFAKSNESKYDNIYFTNYIGRPYIYTLFYTKYDPSRFRQEADITRDNFGFVHVNSFGKFKFPDTLPIEATQSAKDLYFDGIEKVPTSTKIVKTFHLLNGKPDLAAFQYE